MNGGHTLYFDRAGESDDEELLRALREIGALEQARLFKEARLLQREAEEAVGQERDSLWELIEDVDLRFGGVKPEINDLLAAYFEAHPTSFP